MSQADKKAVFDLIVLFFAWMIVASVINLILQTLIYLTEPRVAREDINYQNVIDDDVFK